MTDRKKFNETIIQAWENVIKKHPNPTALKKWEIIKLIANEPGPKIGIFYSLWMIDKVIRDHLKYRNELNKK